MDGVDMAKVQDLAACVLLSTMMGGQNSSSPEEPMEVADFAVEADIGVPAAAAAD